MGKLSPEELAERRRKAAQRYAMQFDEHGHPRSVHADSGPPADESPQLEKRRKTAQRNHAADWARRHPPGKIVTSPESDDIVGHNSWQTSWALSKSAYSKKPVVVILDNLSTQDTAIHRLMLGLMLEKLGCEVRFVCPKPDSRIEEGCLISAEREVSISKLKEQFATEMDDGYLRARYNGLLDQIVKCSSLQT